MQQHSENEWIEWAGGECPVPADAEVFVRYRPFEFEPHDGSPGQGPVAAKSRYWDHHGDVGDIIAYRVVQS